MKNAKYSINANLVYKNGYSGKNVNIAVLDTGVFKHKQLDGCIKHFMDFVGGKETCYDDNGHGTHVCGILSAADIGMAPGAGLYVFKVLDYLGIEKERARVEWVSAAEGARFASVMNDFVDTITKLGENRKLRDLRCEK